MQSEESKEQIIKVRVKYENGRCHLNEKMIKCINTETPNLRPKQENMVYVPYKSDEVNDDHWGCAWRAIQMVISSQNEIPKFRWLYSFFGQRVVLEDLYKAIHNLQGVPQFLSDAKYAPQDLNNGWAEPFIGYLVFQFLGYNADLLLINAYPQYANAPKEVFTQAPLNFSEFVQYLMLNKNPVMIDDSKFAMVIYGIRKEGNNVILKIGDPHIFSNLDNHTIGCYEVVLDSEGRQISCSIGEEEKAQYMYPASYQGVQFYDKPWMATTIRGKWDNWDVYIKEQLIIMD